MVKIISRIPEKIKRLRIENNLTQKQVADMLEIDRSTYSYYESGKIKLDVKTILSLSRIFGVDYTDILDVEKSNVCADVTRNSSSTSECKKKLDAAFINNLSSEEENLLLSLRLLPSDAYMEVMNIISEKLKSEHKIWKKLWINGQILFHKYSAKGAKSHFYIWDAFTS